MEIIFRPLPGWPKTPTANRTTADFAPDFNKVLVLLNRELRGVKAKGVVIQTGHKEKDISVTIGRPLANTVPSFPGVIVLADTQDHGTLNWTCDRYKSWVDNLRNIALYMERQRLLSTQGIGTGKEAYAGHKMLTGPETAAGPMTIEAAARWVGEATVLPPGLIIKERATWERAYRDAAAQFHPDRGGTPEQWKRLQDAKTLLDGLHQGRK